LRDPFFSFLRVKQHPRLKEGKKLINNNTRHVKELYYYAAPLRNKDLALLIEIFFFFSFIKVSADVTLLRLNWVVYSPGSLFF